MDKFGTKKPDTPSEAIDNNAANVVDVAIDRMKSGAIVREERNTRIKFVLCAAVVVAGLAAFSTLDFVYQTPDGETKANGDIVITLTQGQQGHYFAKGEVNGEPVKFIVDTGATEVVIPMKVAKKIGLPLGRKITTVTANGYGTAYETGLKTIQLGDIKLKGVKASVSEGLAGGHALLGMSFLRRTNVELNKGTMTITY